MKQSNHTLPGELISFAGRFLEDHGVTARSVQWKPLKKDGSDRTLYRLSYPEGSVILAINERPPVNSAGVSENDSFLYLCCHLRGKGFPLPEIYEYRSDRGWFIMEDLGEVHLCDEVIRLKKYPHRCEALYRKVLAILPLMQVEGADGLDPARIHSAAYDTPFVRQWESGYFFRSFLAGYRHLPLAEDYLADEFEALADALSATDNSFFLYRDFQSRNIMIKDAQLRFIDFQGGRNGPLHYDLASLLLDPYVDLPDNLRGRLMNVYLKELSKIMPVDEGRFRSDYLLVALHRNMQVLAAFAHLSTVKRREHFKRYIPPAVASLKKLTLLDTFSPYKKLRKVVGDL